MIPRVLVADDSNTMRKIILRISRRSAFPRRSKHPMGTKPCKPFIPGHFDLVLTDWNMPGKSGLEVVKEIRRKDPKVPIIMITTEAEKSRVIQAIQAGVSDYLVKPFTAEILREKLEKHGCGYSQVV